MRSESFVKPCARVTATAALASALAAALTLSPGAARAQSHPSAAAVPHATTPRFVVDPITGLIVPAAAPSAVRAANRGSNIAASRWVFDSGIGLFVLDISPIRALLTRLRNPWGRSPAPTIVCVDPTTGLMVRVRASHCSPAAIQATLAQPTAVLNLPSPPTLTSAVTRMSIDPTTGLLVPVNRHGVQK